MPGLRMRLYRALAPLAKRTGIHRAQIGTRSVGEWAHELLFPRRRLVRTPFGAAMYSDITESLTAHLWWEGRYEPGTTRVFQRMLRPGMTVIDVGAHIGYFTLLACGVVGNSGRVYAFEPEPRNFDLLVHNLTLNGFTNASPQPVAVADRPGPMSLWVAEKSTGSSLVAGATESTSHISVSVVTLDAFLSERGWPSVDLVKIDVEGAELAVVHGMRETIRRNPRLAIVMEISPGNLARAGVAPEVLIDVLSDAGFAVATIEGTTGALAPFTLKELEHIPSNDSYPYINVLAVRNDVQGGA